jgi:spermidine synthase
LKDLRFALVLACFLLSGFAALLYQTVWARELSFVFGTSDLAVAAVLAAYMAGLALGAAIAAPYATRLRRPVLAYGVLELGIAICALGVPWGIRGVNALYVSVLGGGNELPEMSSASTLLQLAGAFAVLLLPTAFMGATLPLLARHAVRAEEQISTRVGSLYAVNTLGAIAGTLCAAFWLMPELGLRRTVWVGAALNGVVFGLAALLARGASVPAAAPGEPERPAAAEGAAWILPAIALSGAVSFAYEVLWTRLLGHLLGASIHAFATMLASFLLGIALGSAAASRMARTPQQAALGFALSQLGIALTSWAAFSMVDQLPALAHQLGAGPASPLPSLVVAGAALLPITLCIGATFPFAVRILARHPDQAGPATARVYAWNTMGAIAGSLGAGFLLLPGVGFEGTLLVGAFVNLVLAAATSLALTPRRIAPAVMALAAGCAMALVPPGPPWKLLTSSPMQQQQSAGEIIYYAVGRTSTVMLTELDGRYQLTTDGLPEAWIDSKGMPVEINVAHWLTALPALVRPDARDLLVVGLGGGMALELVPRTYDSIEVIELEPEVEAANAWIAPRRARDPLSNSQVRIHIGDARGTLQLTGKRWDAIVSQPSHPWTAGASHLYTREFFELARSRLMPDGVFVQWIGIHFVDESLLQSLLAAMVDVFPYVEVYRPRVHGVLFVGSGVPIDGLTGAARALETSPEDFARLGIDRLEDFAAAWSLDAAGSRAVAGEAPPNTDDENLLAAHSIGLGNSKLNAQSLRAMLSDHDPLVDAAGLDRSALARRLASLGQLNRATDLAMAGEDADEEAALGWVELAQGRSPRAARHFERALSLSPDHRDALAGSIASRQLELSAGNSSAGLPVEALDAGYSAVIEGWRFAEAGDWQAVSALDEELARIEPGDGLFEAAVRLRVRGLLESGDPAAGMRAVALCDVLLSRSTHPYFFLLRARAAIQAGEPSLAAGSLWRVIPLISASQRGRALAERALEIAREMPGVAYDEIRHELERRARRSTTAASLPMGEAR